MKLQPVLMVFILIIITTIGIACDEDESGENPADMPYNVQISPDDFETVSITGNQFFPLIPRTTMVYEGENEEGLEVRVEEMITGETRKVMNVTCVVVNAREWEEGELIEQTFDWYAQDKSGNVWYFGENSQEIEEGEVVSTGGSWEAGVDGALPGIIMLANPIEGLWYRQEYYEGEAEDVSQILSLNESVNVPYGDYQNCLQTAEWNPLEPGIVEGKFYAAGIGLVRVVSVKGESGFEELTEIIAE